MSLWLNGRKRRKAYERREELIALPPPRVLLAEDDPDLRGLLTEALRMDGLSVIPAKNGIALLDQIGSALLFGDPEPIDLVVSDIRMPGLTGLQVLASVRGLEVGIPVVLMSAYGDQRTRDEAFRLGVSAFFDKPFDIEELCRVVGTIARGKEPA
jgi:CheY-like chemotaxis protein